MEQQRIEKLFEIAKSINDVRFDVDIDEMRFGEGSITVNWSLQDAKLGWVWPEYVETDPYAWECQIRIRITDGGVGMSYDIHDRPDSWANGLSCAETQDLDEIERSLKDIVHAPEEPELPYTEWETVRLEEVHLWGPAYGYPELLKRTDLTLVDIETDNEVQYGVYWSDNSSKNTDRIGAARSIAIISEKEAAELKKMDAEGFDDRVGELLEAYHCQLN
jgi:hypothetical protein